LIWRLPTESPPRVPELEALATALVGARLDLWFVSRGGNVLAVVSAPDQEAEGELECRVGPSDVPAAVWTVARAMAADLIEGSIGVVWEHPTVEARHRREDEAEEAAGRHADLPPGASAIHCPACQAERGDRKSVV